MDINKTVAIQTGITGNVTAPSGSANDGVGVPEGTKRIEFFSHLTSSTPTPTVPVAFWGRHRASKKWFPLPGAEHADIYPLTQNVWATSIDISSLDRVATVVAGSAGTFSLDTYATFTD